MEDADLRRSPSPQPHRRAIGSAGAHPLCLLRGAEPRMVEQTWQKVGALLAHCRMERWPSNAKRYVLSAMTCAILTLAFGFHGEDLWLSRYSRFQADLPAGCHRVTGQIYTPPYDDLAGNELHLIANGQRFATMRAACDDGWQPFAAALPELQEPTRLDLVLRTTCFFRPPAPDRRILGLLLQDLAIELDPG